jgi:GNAT superfamily N-acetyltransferase
MDSINIRKAALTDAAAVTELSAQLGYPTSVGQLQNRLSAILNSNEHTVFVACLSEGNVIGWIHVFLTQRVESNPFAELGGLVVSEHYKRKGVGKRLLAAAEEWARQKGLLKLRVRSRIQRNDARAFYEHMGFSISKDQHVFEKPLMQNYENL